MRLLHKLYLFDKFAMYLFKSQRQKTMKNRNNNGTDK